jgi:hypothetical protein
MNSNKKGNAGEEAVNNLAFNTYFEYWCFPNPKDELGDKKEICDLLILFKKTVIIFSIKNYSFKDNYERYFNRTLTKALSQIHGAERKLFQSNHEIRFTHSKIGFKNFNPENYETIHRIIININTKPLFHPGGLMTKNNVFTHVFNWESFLGIVSELDTIPDFIRYLLEREVVFEQKDFIMALGDEMEWTKEINQVYIAFNRNLANNLRNFILFSGTELDLLSIYLTNERKFDASFYSDEYHGAVFQMDGNWNSYIKRKEVSRKKEEDRLSYFVDEFVKREVLYKTDANNLKLAAELLSLNRFERRILGKLFFEFVETNKDKEDYFVARRYGKIAGVVVGFLVHDSKMLHEHVMSALNLAIEGYCVWNKYQDQKIIIIGVSDNLTQFKFGYLDNIEPFPKEYEDLVKEDLKKLNWFTRLDEQNIHFKEYPD